MTASAPSSPTWRACRCIGDLLRYWGGEAVYSSHDRHPEMGKVIAGIGPPCHR